MLYAFLARLDQNFSLFLADNILSSPSTQQTPTTHVIRFGWTPINDPYNLKTFRTNHP